MPRIPEDLQIKILSRVPAKLVTRFRGLSKFHRTLIDSPDFMEKHGERATDWNQIIVYRRIPAGDDMVMLDLTKFGAKEERLANPLRDQTHFHIVGCCAGILCLLYSPTRWRGGHILLWNPLTRSDRRIIPVEFPTDVKIKYYFGHDEVTDDLKILKLLSAYNCEVYSSRAGCWRKHEIDRSWQEISGFFFPRPRHGIFVKGTNSVHANGLLPRIATFDFASEKFGKIDVPSECHGNLSDFHGNLCMVSYKRKSRPWSVWVMKEYGVEGSWTCLFSLDHSDLWAIKPLGFVKDGRQLAFLGKEFNSNKYRLRAYDLEKKKVIDNQMISSLIDYGHVEPVVYTPSLRRV